MSSASSDPSSSLPSTSTPAQTSPSSTTSTPGSSSVPDSSSSSAAPASTPASTPASQTTTAPNSSSPSSTAVPPGSSSVPSSSGGASSVPGSATPSSTTTIPSSTLSTFSTQFVTTDSAGQVSTVILTSTAFVPAGSSGASASNRSSTNTGAIVGGVVGGVGGALLLALVAFLIFRWRRKRDEDFDGNFDPDRVVRHSGPLDLGADDALRPDPFPYGDPNGGGGGPDGTAPMGYADQNHSFVGPLAAGAAGAGAYGAYNRAQSPPSAYSGPASESSHYPPSTLPSQPGSNYYYGAGAMHQSPGPSMNIPPSSSSDNSWGAGARSGESAGPAAAAAWAQPRTAKEREVLAQRAARGGGLSVANTSDADSGVVQHMDGGRVEPDDSEPPREIPPSYDSIPADRR